MKRFVVVGSDGDRRIALFQDALTGCGFAPADVLSYADLLEARRIYPGPETILRIESPGKDFEAQRALLRHGTCEAASSRFECISLEDVQRLAFEHGRILSPYQWFVGFAKAMRTIECSVPPATQLMNHPTDIAWMFDKTRCRDMLAENGLPVPRSLGSIRSYDELLDGMRQSGISRVFVKLRHGSSASGVVAYRFSGRQHQAMTTVEMVGDKLFNTRRIRVLKEPRAIASLIDALCCHPTHVEQWIPKAGIANKTFDLRVVVIAGKARHIVVRMSDTPMTNLHLLNQRGDPDTVRARMKPRAWTAALETCERVMDCFPRSLYAGIDLLITPDFGHHYVLEVNAFGDLLPGVLCDGIDTYTHEIQAMLN